MASANGVGLTSISRDIHTLQEGQPFDLEGVLPRAWRNPILPQISTVTITGFGADADSIVLSITLPSGTTVSVTTTRASAVPVDDAAAAAALAVLVNALAALNGHVVATSLAGVLTLTFDHPGIDYTVSTAVTACVATVATSQAAGGSAVPFGRFCAAGTTTGQAALRPLTSTDRGPNVRGIVARPIVAVNLGSTSVTATDGVAVGELADVVYDGHVAMRNNGATAAAPGGQVWAVISTTGGDELGEARSDASGVAGLWTITPTAAELDFLILVEWTAPNGEKESVPLVSANPDGSASATEICNGWRTAFATAQADGKLTGFTAGGTATLTLTGPAGQPFVVSDVGVGVAATVETTPAVIYATPLDVKRFYWAEAVAIGAVGPIMCRA